MDGGVRTPAARTVTVARSVYRLCNEKFQLPLYIQAPTCRLRSNEMFATLPHSALFCSYSYHKNSAVNYHKMFHDLGRTNLCYFHQMSTIVSSPHFLSLSSMGLTYENKDRQKSRKYKLTASTFGSAIGMWHGRRIQLWLEKIGALPPFFENSKMKKFQEEVALKQYLLITRNDVQFLDFQLYNENNPNDDWLAASPDGIIPNFPSGGVLEIKCPFFQGNSGKAWLQVPVCYMPQAQGLMEILDKDWLDLYCWTPKSSSLFRIPRDKQYWGLLKIALSDFWWKHVHPAREICTRTTYTRASMLRAKKEVISLMPARRHKLFNKIARASRYLVHHSKLVVAMTHHVPGDQSKWWHGS